MLGRSAPGGSGSRRFLAGGGPVDAGEPGARGQQGGDVLVGAVLTGDVGLSWGVRVGFGLDWGVGVGFGSLIGEPPVRRVVKVGDAVAGLPCGGRGSGGGRE